MKKGLHNLGRNLHTEKARRMTRTEAAWLAGLFDGEGTLINSMKCRGGDRRCLRIAIRMTNEEIVRRVQTLAGTGNIQYWKPKNPNHSPCWTWYSHAGNAVFILKQLLPWLIVKRESAEEWISFYEQ